MDFPRFTEALKLEMARKAASEEELLRLQDEEPGAAERGWRNAMEIAIYMVYCNIYIYDIVSYSDIHLSTYPSIHLSIYSV